MMINYRDGKCPTLVLLATDLTGAAGCVFRGLFEACSALFKTGLDDWSGATVALRCTFNRISSGDDTGRYQN